MLRKLERLILTQSGPLNLPELARMLDADPRAVAGMLITLAQKGRLTAVTSGCAACDSCPVHNACQLPTRQSIAFRVNEAS